MNEKRTLIASKSIGAVVTIRLYKVEGLIIYYEVVIDTLKYFEPIIIEGKKKEEMEELYNRKCQGYLSRLAHIKSATRQLELLDEIPEACSGRHSYNLAANEALAGEPCNSGASEASQEEDLTVY